MSRTLLLAGGPQPPLLSFRAGGGGTFTRGSEGSYYTAPPNTAGGFLAWATNNIIREDKRDGVSNLFLFEPTKTNLCLWSEDFTQASWVKTNCSVTGTTAIAPDGAADCCTVSYAVGAASLAAVVAGTANATTYVTSVWVRKVSGTGNAMRLRVVDRAAASTYTADLPVSSTWTRLEQSISWGTGASTPAVYLASNAANQDIVVEVWGFQVETSLVTAYIYKTPTSYIRTTTAAVPRSSDRLDFLAAAVPYALRAGKYTYRYSPLFASGAETNGLFSIYSNFGAYEGSQIVAPGSAAKIRETVGATPAIAYESNVLTWSRNAVMTAISDLPVGQMTVSGALTGDGTGPWGIPVIHPSVNLQIGGSAANFSAMGRLGQPYAMSPTPAPAYLLDLAPGGGGTFTRASEASYYNAPPNDTGGFLSWAPTDTIREDKRDGVSGLYLIEAPQTNLCLYTEALDDASWTKTSATVGVGVTTAPDGDVDCKTVSFAAVALARVTRSVAGTTDGSFYVTSVWVRRPAGAGNVRLGFVDRSGAGVYSADKAVGTTWTRIEDLRSFGTGAFTPTVGIYNSTAGLAQDVEVWGFNVMWNVTEGSAFNAPTSYIRNTSAVGVRAGDDMTWAVTPTEMLSGHFQFRFSPIYGTGESSIPSAYYTLGTAYSGVDSRTGIATISTQKNNVIQFSAQTISFGRNALMTADINLPGAVNTVTGAASGNGPGGSGTATVHAQQASYCGRYNAASKYYANARIGAPYAMPPAPLAIGIQGYAPTSFYRSAAGVLMANTPPLGVAVAVHVLAVPTGSESIIALDGVIARGWGLVTLSGPAVRFRVINAAVAVVNSPTYTITAADIGQTILFVGLHDGTTVRLYRAGAQVGAGTAVTGYSAATAADKTAIGIRSNSDIDQASSFRFVGGLSFTGTPTLADIQAWGAATQAALTVQDMGGAGVVVVDRWRASENVAVGASWVDGVSGQVLTKTGAALISVPFTPTWDT